MDQKLKTVFRASTLIEANIVKGMLESHGIRTFIQGEHTATAYGGLVAGLDIRLQVDDIDEIKAKRLIEEYRSGD